MNAFKNSTIATMKNVYQNGLLPCLLIASALLSGCKAPQSPYATFSPEAGTYAQTQRVEITIPATATDVYLTTDSVDPIPSEACKYAGEDLIIDRPTIVKLTYQFNNQTYTYERLYKVEETKVNNHFTNRAVIETWEHFFLKQIYRQFSPPDNSDSLLTLEDGAGGSVSLNTRILSRGPFSGVPTSGSQTYTFRYFEKTDDDTGETIMLRSGVLEGYRDKNAGNYGTLAPLTFGGKYNGWAEGRFNMNQEGITTDGFYKIHCEDLGCAPFPVTYYLGANKGLIEVDQTRHANTRSCLQDTNEPSPAMTASLR